MSEIEQNKLAMGKREGKLPLPQCGQLALFPGSCSGDGCAPFCLQPACSLPKQLLVCYDENAEVVEKNGENRTSIPAQGGSKLAHLLVSVVATVSN